jgi:hypothetical protein
MKHVPSFPGACRIAVTLFLLFVLLCLTFTAGPALAQDTWESLPDVPFARGVSAGGGLTTDGTYIYAADLSGDGDDDYIDLNDDGSYTTGESLQELGIPNGSVRFARYNPAAGTWDLLPALHPAGIGGDAFSAGDLSGGLFFAGGSLFYYQFRAGPNQCALYRYVLAEGSSGTWSEVWDISEDQALISASAGLVGVDTPTGPVIIHHRGGGDYSFVRSTGLTNGPATHTVLTPSWPFSGAHFPRCGAWAYDPTQGRLYHMSGNQLIRWDPSPVYSPAGFLDAVPNGTDPLAVSATAIASLSSTLGWNPGGTEANPGASLWGNAIVVVNDPSGSTSGPGGLDTGANVLYLVRGETSVDGWPFNEGRGVVTNGHFARYFPSSGQSQNLPSAPFCVGKGSAACYLDGSIYLLQGETRNSPDLPGNVGPLNQDGIRQPGKGFARFSLRSSSVSGPLIIPVGEYLTSGFATLSAPTNTGTVSLFDQQWDTFYQTTENPADIIISFPSARAVGAARGRFGDAPHEWSLDAADSTADLVNGTNSFVHVFGPLTVTNGAIGWREWNAQPVTRRYFRFRVASLGGGPVEIRELELQRPKPAITITVDGTAVQVNDLAITPGNAEALAGGNVPFYAEASLSLGPARYNLTTQVVWQSSALAVATISTVGVASALAAGETQIGARLGSLAGTARLTVATANPEDNDLSVAWIQRLPSLPYVWGSTNAARDGWPREGSNVTWRAMVKNWYPLTRTNVSYRWLLDGTPIASGSVALAPRAWTGVDIVQPWSFTRRQLRFEIDPANALPEFSETNNTLSVWTDAITVGFWVEQSVYAYFHQHQSELGDGANGWEDWAQRQVARWNAMFAAAVDPVDSPQGVLDRIRLDKITLVADGALPLAGGLAGNHPDTTDQTIDLEWGFPATLLNSGMYDNHTNAEDWNAFYYEGSLIHELGHARFLIDAYGFNVGDSASNMRVHVRHAGQLIAGTPYLPRTYPWWDHVLLIQPGSPFDGLMGTSYTSVDRYSTAALNLIAGQRATRGNYNAPYNIGAFINDLPAANQVQLLDARGQPLAGATVTLYRATGTNDWYSKHFDDIPDLSFTADAQGRLDVGRNPFADGPLQHTYGISTMVALLKAEVNGRTGFAFLKAGLFNMEYWRGRTNQGGYSLVVPMLGAEHEIAAVRSSPGNQTWLVQVIVGGDVQPQSVTVSGEEASYQEGSWWVWSPGPAGARMVVATWPGMLPVVEWVNVPATTPRPMLAVQSLPMNPTQVLLSWPTSLGHAYDLEATTDLSHWTTVADGRVFGAGDTFQRLQSATDPRGFFRLVVWPLGD